MYEYGHPHTFVRILVWTFRILATLASIAGVWIFVTGSRETLRIVERDPNAAAVSGVVLVITIATTFGPAMFGLLMFAVSECMNLLLVIADHSERTSMIQDEISRRLQMMVAGDTGGG